MTVTQLIDILKTYEMDTVVVLPVYNHPDWSQEKLEVIELRLEEIKPIELYEVSKNSIPSYTLDDGTGPPLIEEGDVVLDKKKNGVLLGWS